MAPTKNADYDAVIVGSGFGGIRSLWELRQLGLSVKCFEFGSDVGGAWFWNRYPGARTDSEAWVYAMNFDPAVHGEWDYHERYPSQEEVQNYIRRVVARFDLRKHIQFDTYIKAARYDEDNKIWIITAANGAITTCRYFLPATGPLSVAKTPDFPGLESFKGEWYQSSKWPEKVNVRGKRIAIIGTGATGVQIIPKLASVAKELSVFQRTPNYVLPGRNYIIDEDQAQEIKQHYDRTWNAASSHPSGLAMKSTGKTTKQVAEPEQLRQILDRGWELGGFYFHFATVDDLVTDPESNAIASEYLRQKIRAIVHDPNTAELLCPKYPYLSKRPPCGHFYYEAFNRPNVNLVDICQQQITFYEDGIRTSSGAEYEVDTVIFALGFDAATGALSEMDVRGVQNKSLGESWAAQIETFAGILAPGFPNMFMICGPHVPFGNMPVVLDLEVQWIGQSISYMEANGLAEIRISDEAIQAWSAHLDEAFRATLFAENAGKAGSWFVGANIPGKPANALFYFGGVPAWKSLLDREAQGGWKSMKFAPLSEAGCSKERPTDVDGARPLLLA